MRQLKILSIANGIAFIVTVVVNYLSNSGYFNGNTMATISARYQNYFTPAGYAFSIWGLIYISLAGFIIYQIRSVFKNRKDTWPVAEIGSWFLVSCIANICWVITWLNDETGWSVLIMVLLLFSLIKIIHKTRMELDYLPLRKIAFVWWPFCMYSGWITLALIANMAAWLTKIQWNGWGISEVSWTIIMILIAGVINCWITWTRNMREFSIVGVWGLIAVAVANKNQNSFIVTIAILVAVILFISGGIHGYLNRNKNVWKMNQHE